MITFLFFIFILVLGYFFFGKKVEKNFTPSQNPTPAVKINDGVDYIPMPVWKVYLIQLLNIAGTGPIFGALSGALFGPIVYLWIVLGCIFAGGVHDYMCGMLSVRNNGASISEITGTYLGPAMKQIMRVFSVILLVMCGVVFTTGPAELLGLLTPSQLTAKFWLYLVLIYYLFATFVPIDKVIGKIYPLFGICLLIMTFGVSGSLLLKPQFEMPEIWENFANLHASSTPVWPFMFITVACGAISGFHATQSPMMARCIKTEKQGRLVFYGAMISEGIIALVWAAAGVTCYESSQALLAAGGGCSAVVYNICNTCMGKIGALLAMIGVIVCPISSGDTAYRSARLTLADWLKIDQKNWKKRLAVTLPILIAGAIICNLDYSYVWRYFSWANQTLAMISLWASSVFLVKEKKNCLFTVIPATLMSAVTCTYICCAPEGLGFVWKNLGLQYETYYSVSLVIGLLFALTLLFVFCRFKKKTDTRGI